MSKHQRHSKADSPRDLQLKDLVQTQAGHGDIISHTHTFAVARNIQAEILQSLAHSASPSSILFLGPGDGSEALTIFQRSSIDPSGIEIVAFEISQARAEAFKVKFPSSNVAIHDFSSGDFGAHLKESNFDVIQCGFVLNDQTEQGKRNICKNAFQALKPDGVFIVAEILMVKYPNIASKWESEDAEETVNRELQEYYEPYLEQINEFPAFPAAQLSAYETSIRNAWRDARAHTEGREAFDTKETLGEILEESGFKEIQFFHGFNKGWVILAKKTAQP